MPSLPPGNRDDGPLLERIPPCTTPVSFPVVIPQPVLEVPPRGPYDW